MNYYICIKLRYFIILTIFFSGAGRSWSALLDEAVWFTRPVGAGVTWKYYHFNSLFGAKQSISITEIDLNNSNVSLKIPFRNSYVGPSPGTGSSSYPRALTSTFAGEVTNALAAVNGTYFNTASFDSANPTVAWGGGTTFLRVDGSTIHTSDGSNVNNFAMGLLFNSRSDVTIMKKSGAWSNRTGSWSNMMISGPPLVTAGVIETYAESNDHANLRHPRTAVGKITSSKKLLLVTVDGRNAEAAGMSCTELANVMKALGCDYAINLDGGGSTTMWIKGEPNSGVVNYPTDNGLWDHAGERRAANALVVVSTAAAKPAFDGRLTSVNFNGLVRSGEAVPLVLKYTNIGSSTWTSGNVKVVPSRAFGRTSAFIPSGVTNYFTMSPASVAPGATATFTLNLTAPSVSNNTNYSEYFALWHTTNGYFGPQDDAAKMSITVRPPVTYPPPRMIIQGTGDGPNNQWYVEGASGWSNSSVSFEALGVADTGSQRYATATSANRYADFKPMFDVRGIYKVEASFPYSSNNINQVAYTINHLGGTTNVILNQNSSALANQWQTLGSFGFGTGTVGDMGVHSIRVSNGSVTGNRFYSGALRIDYVSPLAETEDWQLY